MKIIVVDGKGYDVYVDIRNDMKNKNYKNKKEFVYRIRFDNNDNVDTSVTVPATNC